MKPLYTPYTILKPLVDRMDRLNRRVRRNLEKAYMRVPHREYVASMLFYPILCAVAAASVLGLGLTFPQSEPLSSAVALYLKAFGSALEALGVPGQASQLIASGLTVALSFAAPFAALYLYPLYLSSEAARRIEADLIYTLNYMAILYTAGVTVEKIFASLAVVGDVYSVRDSALNVVRSVEFLGYDILEALDDESRRTGSRIYASFLQGMKATAATGGDLESYLTGMAERSFADYRDSISNMIENLDLVAEFYVALLLVMPIVVVITVLLVGMIGGSIGALPPLQVVQLIVYVAVPFSSAALLIIIDMVLSRWRL